MIDLIKGILAETPCDGYEITDITKKGWEFYFIRHRLDQNRAKQVREISVRVYKKSEDGAYLGSAAGVVAPTATKDEVRKLISDLADQASLVKNPVYTLNPKAVLPAREQEAVSLEEIAGNYIEALNGTAETETEDLNSYEIFVTEVTKRYISSEGTDETFVYPSSMAEVVVNARNDDSEIELYRLYTSGTCDRETLLHDVNETLSYGKDKLLAGPTPALGKMDVVFTTDAAKEIYNFFAYRLNAAAKVRRYSDWSIGEQVFADGSGDKVTLYAVADLPNSSKNFPLDDEGAPVKDTCLMQENVPKNFWGTRQFRHYLELTEGANYTNFVVEGGKQAAQELRAGDYLEIVEFSDFQVNPMTGAIAGEIRLGYLHRKGEVEIVSGGSISGSMNDYAGTMRFSRETRQYDNVVIPALTRLADVSITGAV